MKKRVVTLLLLSTLICSSMIFSLPFNSIYAAPTHVYIRADGTIEGTNNICRDGSLYMFIGNVTGPLYVEKDNIVIDGQGYTLQGDNRGVVMAEKQNVTLQNLQLTVDGGYVIDIRDARDCFLIGNTLIGTPKTISMPGVDMPAISPLGPIGINFLYSQNITVKDNLITNFSSALSLEWSYGHTIVGNDLVNGITGINIVNTTGCTFRDNRMINSSFSIRSYPLYQYENDLDDSNTIDGKPIIYWQDVTSRAVPSDTSYIVLVNCKDITVQNGSPYGINVISTTDSTIANVTMSGRGDGINLLHSSSISILGNALLGGAIAIAIENSSNNTITGNEISNYMTRGINLGASNTTIITNNVMANNSYAIAPSQDSVSTDNLIAQNTFADNGFALVLRGRMQIQNNSFTNNDQAVLCYSGSNTITCNTFLGNNRAVILQSTENILKGNLFINNTDSLPTAAANFNNNIDSSNTLNGKPIYYWVNRHNEIVPSNAGFIALINCTNITVQNLNISNQINGILLAFTSNSIITNNVFTCNTNGIHLYGSPNNQFTYNNITGNDYAVYISGGTISFIGGPISYTPSSGNLFHHNNFVGNNQTLYDLAGAYNVNSPPSANTWDNSKEGNYWSNYSGTDVDGDGIGDARYFIYANNTDNFPLISAVKITLASQEPSPSRDPAETASPGSPNSISSSDPTPDVPEFSTWVFFALLLLVTVTVFASIKHSCLCNSEGVKST